MNSRVTFGLLIALVIGHIVLAAMYASITPYRQGGILLGSRDPKTGGPQGVSDVGAPDERQHVNYVMHLLGGKGFPVFLPGSPDFGETYQSHQPPLYYLLAAGWSKATGASDLEQKESGPKLRFLNALIGGGTVAGVFFLALWGFRRSEVALAAASVAAFLPMQTALSGAVSNDPLLICLCTWVLALIAKGLRDGWSWKCVLLIGLLTGLSFLTKTTALALIPVLLLAMVLPPPKDREDLPMGVRSKPSLPMVGAAAVIALACGGPWWVRNQQLYGDPFAIKAFNEAFVGSAQKSTILMIIQAEDANASAEATYWKDWVGWWTARSFFGAFGYMDIWLNESGLARKSTPNTLYRLLLAATALCFVGWTLALSKPEWKETLPIQLVNGVFFLVVLALFLKFNMQYFQAQARYLLPAIGPIGCGFAVGAHQLLSKRSVLALPAVAGLFFLVNFYAISQLPDAFAKRTESASRLP